MTSLYSAKFWQSELHLSIFYAAKFQISLSCYINVKNLNYYKICQHFPHQNSEIINLSD